VVANDAGAMHSGNHWAWVLTRPGLAGQRVTAEAALTFPMP
jgi:hypothetical protein